MIYCQTEVSHGHRWQNDNSTFEKTPGDPSQLAKQRDETESEVVRHAIEKLAEADSKSPSVLDLLKKTKAIGIVKNAPPDLSTNPKYLEDFGRD